MSRLAVAVLAMVVAGVLACGASAQVLRVGSYKGVAGQFSSIQAAVDAARPGDIVLVGPGDYHERADRRLRLRRGPQPDSTPAGVVITTPKTTVRGMDRNRVVIDGTLPGRGPACSSSRSRQDFGRRGSDRKPLGRNGILIYKTDGVSVENLTVCNFLNGRGKAGNELWWNGGDGSGKIGLGDFYGAYLNATSTYYENGDTAASYGIFSSNSRGPGTWIHTYASNFSDASYYIGACAQRCNQVIDDARAQYSALGYSGTNSGGTLIIKNSEFDHNLSGIVTNSQNNDDAPSPQDGACPNPDQVSPITKTHSCEVYIHNDVHDNNNPNVPRAGVAGNAPVGSGIVLAGARRDTVMANRIHDNGAWGVLVVPYPDSGPPPPIAHCGGGDVHAGDTCIFDDYGNAVLGNSFAHNGFFGNDTNGDIGEYTLTPHPINCYARNDDASGTVTTSPGGLQQSKPSCGPSAPPNQNFALLTQALCDFGGTGTGCPPGTHYPRTTQVVLPALPHGLRSMPNPCAGVTPNPWCSGQLTRIAACVARGVRLKHVPLTLARREHFVSVKVNVGSDRSQLFRATRSRASVPVALGRHTGRITVAFTEKIKVGRRTETTSFSRVYRRC